MIFDTDVLIWFFRGNPKAARAIDRDDAPSVSLVSYMELLQGARNAVELRTIKRFVADLGFELLPLSENTGHRASVYLEEYVLRSSMGLADALIAATAVEAGRTMITGNRRHYSPIKELDLRIFRPT